MSPKPFTKPDPDTLKQTLTDEQYRVTQEAATEPPFNNAYWDNHQEGIYVDIVSGQPLFSSTDKYDSGCGWPSFTKPIDKSHINTGIDFKAILPRTELKSQAAGSHLGHLFSDGPKDQGGLRYCINSAALRFVPKQDLKKEGYGGYLSLFDSSNQKTD